MWIHFTLCTKSHLCSSILDQAVICLGEKQGMLINDECGSWYNRGGDFLLLVWEEKKKLYSSGPKTGSVRPTPLQIVRSMGIDYYGG